MLLLLFNGNEICYTLERSAECLPVSLFFSISLSLSLADCINKMAGGAEK